MLENMGTERRQETHQFVSLPVEHNHCPRTREATRDLPCFATCKPPTAGEYIDDTICVDTTSSTPKIVV